MQCKIPTFDEIQLKTSFEMERDYNDLEHYFLNNLEGEIEKNISSSSFKFMKELNSFQKNKDHNNMKNQFHRLMVDKMVNKIYTINEVNNIFTSVKRLRESAFNMLKLNIKKTKWKFKIGEISKEELYRFLGIYKEDKLNVLKLYSKNKLVEILDKFKNNSLLKLKNIFQIEFKDGINKNYFSLNREITQKINSINHLNILDFDLDKSFFENSSNYLVIFDGYKFVKVEEMLQYISTSNLTIEDYNNFIGFYLFYFKILFKDNKIFQRNYLSKIKEFQKNFIDYYGNNLLNEISKRCGKWLEFLNIYNESLEKVSPETSWGLMLFLNKEFVMELNRLNLLIFRMTYDPLKIKNLLQK